VELDRVLADHQAFGDLAVNGTTCHQFQHLAFTRRQIIRCGLVFCGMGEFVQDLASHHLRQPSLTTHHPFEQGEKLLRIQALLQIAGGATLDRLKKVRIFLRNGEDDDAHLRVPGLYQACCLQAIKPRHANIHKDEVRMQRFRQAHSFDAFAGLADHLVIAAAEQTGDTVAEERMVIGQKYAYGHCCRSFVAACRGTQTMMDVPLPGTDSIRNVPAIACVRSRMVRKP
jgi:hypothetical protein